MFRNFRVKTKSIVVWVSDYFPAKRTLTIHRSVRYIDLRLTNFVPYWRTDYSVMLFAIAIGAGIVADIYGFQSFYGSGRLLRTVPSVRGASGRYHRYGLWSCYFLDRLFEKATGLHNFKPIFDRQRFVLRLRYPKTPEQKSQSSNDAKHAKPPLLTG